MTHDPFLDGPPPFGCTGPLAVVLAIAGAVTLVVAAIATWGASAVVGLVAVLAFPAALGWGLADTWRRARARRMEFHGIDTWAAAAEALRKGGR